MIKRITDLSKEEMKKICEESSKADGCSHCPLNTYIGCFYDFKLNGYLDLFVNTKTLKRYIEKDKSA
jgi:hypothetical protein